MCLLFVRVCLFWIFDINGIIQYVNFCIWLLSLNMFLVYPGSMYQYFIYFYVWSSTPLYWYTTICLSIHSLVGIGLFSSFGYCCEHLCTISVWVSVFNSLGILSRKGIAGSYGNPMFNFLRNDLTVFPVFHLHFYQQFWEIQFLFNFTNSIIFYFSNSSHPSGCEVVCYCNFDLPWLMI